jgi:hypothetical protein
MSISKEVKILAYLSLLLRHVKKFKKLGSSSNSCLYMGEFFYADEERNVY